MLIDGLEFIGDVFISSFISFYQTLILTAPMHYKGYMDEQGM